MSLTGKHDWIVPSPAPIDRSLFNVMKSQALAFVRCNSAGTGNCERVGIMLLAC